MRVREWYETGHLVDDNTTIGVIALDPIADHPGERSLSGKADGWQQDRGEAARLEQSTGEERRTARGSPGREYPDRLGERDDHRNDPCDHCRNHREVGRVGLAPAGHPKE